MLVSFIAAASPVQPLYPHAAVNASTPLSHIDNTAALPAHVVKRSTAAEGPAQGRAININAIADTLLDVQSNLGTRPLASDPAGVASSDPPRVAEARARVRGRAHQASSPANSPSHRAPQLHVRRGLAHIATAGRSSATQGQHHTGDSQTTKLAKESTVASNRNQRVMDRTHPARLAQKHTDGREASTSADAGDTDAQPINMQAGNRPVGVEQARPAPPHRNTGPVPGCLGIQRITEALNDVRALRYARFNLAFCAAPDKAGKFHGTFVHHPTPRRAGTPMQAMDPWMLVHLQAETQVDDQSTLAIVKYRDRDALASAQQLQPVALGNDVLYDALSISAVPDAQLTARHVDSRRILTRNSFKLLQHRELSGVTRTLLAWFVHRAQDSGVAVNAGFLPIDIGVASYTVRDVVTGMEFHGDNLADVISALERLTGNQLRQDADQLPFNAAMRRTGMEVPALQADNLFIRLEACQPDDPTTVSQQRSDIEFFGALPFALPDRGASGWLYRSSFALMGDRLLFRDATGIMGEVQLQVTSDDVRHYRLLDHQGHVAVFLRDHGLQPGQIVTASHLRQILQNHGLLWLPARHGEVVSALPGVASIQISVSSAAAVGVS